MATPTNPIAWLEIYVDNMARAQKFYETVLQIELSPIPMPEGAGDYEMLFFPWDDNRPNISGALVRSSMAKPGAGGTLAYFGCEDCAIEIARVETAGGKVLQAKFPIGEFGFCGICTDTEGNTIGFHSMA